MSAMHPDAMRVDAWRSERPEGFDPARWDALLLAAQMTVIRNPEGAARELARAQAEAEIAQAQLENVIAGEAA